MLCSNQLSYVAKWRALFAPRGFVSTLRERFFYLLFQMLMPPVRPLPVRCRSILFLCETWIGQPLVAVQRGDLLLSFVALALEAGSEMFALVAGRVERQGVPAGNSVY